MSVSALFRRFIEYYEQRGALRTVGATARYCGTEIDFLCKSLQKMYNWDQGKGYPLRLRVRAVRHGFSAHSYLWLGLNDPDRDAAEYLSSTKRIWKLNHEYVRPIHDKHTFQTLTAPHIDALPTLYGRIDDGQFDPSVAGGHETGLFAALDRGESVVLKPSTGSQGDGIHIVGQDGDTLSIDGDPASRAEITDLIGSLDGYIATEFVTQHSYAASIYPDATNTLRLFSIIDSETGDASVLRAAHRFGSAASAPTDNWSRGGYCAPVDTETGCIGQLISLAEPPRSERDRHPETDARVQGVTVPHWDEVCDLVRRVAEVHRHAPLVGWDVVVGTEGPIILEGNERPGKELLQLEHGILEDPRARRLLELS